MYKALFGHSARGDQIEPAEPAKALALLGSISRDTAGGMFLTEVSAQIHAQCNAFASGCAPGC